MPLTGQLDYAYFLTGRFLLILAAGTLTAGIITLGLWRHWEQSRKMTWAGSPSRLLLLLSSVVTLMTVWFLDGWGITLMIALLIVGFCLVYEQNLETAMKISASERQFRMVWENAADGMRLTDANGLVVLANDAYCRMVDRPREEIIGHSFIEVYQLPKRELLLRKYRERFQAGSIPSLMRRDLVLWNGSRVHLDLSNVFIEFEGRQKLLFSTVRDVTRMLLTEEELRLTYEKLVATVEALPDALLELDVEGRVFDCRSPDPRSLPLLPEQITGKKVRDVLPPEAAEPIMVAIGEASVTGRHTGASFVLSNLTSPAWYEISIARLGQSSAASPHFVALIRDITQRVTAEEGRRRLEQQMQQSQKLESLGVLAGGIAHDFNNLLTAILGNTELVLADLPAESELRGPLRDIKNGSLRAANLCRQMLAYSGQGRLIIEVIDLETLLQDMIQMIEVSVSKKARLQFHRAASLPPVEADATQLRQVVMNLIINAAEALGDKAGVITVATGVHASNGSPAPGLCWGETMKPGSYVSFEVTDTGCGMDATTMGKIFDPFFTTKFTGRGLGLAAVLGIVRGHGGTISVRSQPGTGSTFIVFLPASNKSLPTPKREAGPRGFPRIPRNTVLLVDDEESIRLIGKKMIEKQGLKVMVAKDGIQALDLYQQHSSEIAGVVLDLTMPKWDGIETFRALKRVNPEIRVVLASGYSEYELTERFRETGLLGFIQKPYTLSVLESKLQLLFDHKAPHASPLDESLASS